MQELTFTFQNDSGHHVFVYHWYPSDDSLPLRGIVQIAHGMTETAKRYERFAEFLIQSGYIVYANDHRGHGKTAGSQEELGWPGKDGLNGMVRDVITLGEMIHDKHSELPLFLMGHSMGSFLTQKVMYSRPELYTGFILSGTNGPRPLLSIGEGIARLQIRLQGEEHRSLLLNAITFGNFNKRFLPVHTPFDWLSRDQEEVDKYVKDPHCGFLCSAGFFQQFFSLLQEIHRPDKMRQIPKDKPVYVFSGASDPVGLYGDGVRRLILRYKKLGLCDVEIKLYPEGRHEMLNEINRDEVTLDAINWLERHLP
ncbi:putative lysophospholipase [compost metagenome]